MATDAQPSRSKILWWGLTRRCPRCGSGHLFRHYFELVPDCPKCDLHFERESGYFAGALAINIMVAGGIFAVVFVALLAATIPTVPVAELLAVLVPIVVLVPIIFYPFSKTVWMAVDRGFLQRLDSQEHLD
ncbi:MAG: DUF983 domain-containing protein [Acidimicrobiia bacterium]|nr:DUF983 domain-containing protein [Acidimicrobiia bacterium]